MNETVEIREKVRQVLGDLVPDDPNKLESALERIMDVIDPFQRAAGEELERFRSTFTELAK